MRGGRDERLDELLALRAQARLPLDKAMTFGDPPDRRGLADAELERMGIERER
jgi:hypothetical protein